MEILQSEVSRGLRRKKSFIYFKSLLCYFVLTIFEVELHSDKQNSLFSLQFDCV